MDDQSKRLSKIELEDGESEAQCDPENPTATNAFAIATLTRWGKRTVYERIHKERQDEMRRIAKKHAEKAERRKKQEDRREAKLERERLAEEEEEQEQEEEERAKRLADKANSEGKKVDADEVSKDKEMTSSKMTARL